MKQILFCRRAILRAIQAACVALLLAHVSAVRAQTVTGDGNGNVTISGSGTDFTYDGFTPVVLDPDGTLTVDGSVSITNTTVPNIIDLNDSATISNSGSLVTNYSDLPGSFSSAITSSGGATTTVINNSGTLSATNTSAGSYAAGISYVGTVGGLTVTNSGHISGTSTGDAYGILGMSSDGDIMITSTSSGITSATGSGNGRVAAISFGTLFNGASATVLNQGTITATNEGDVRGIFGGGDGDTSVTNSGTITVTSTVAGESEGIGVYSDNGNVSVTNSGAISSISTESSYGVHALGSALGDVTVHNSASIYAEGVSGTASGLYARSGSGAVLVTNSSTVTAVGSSTVSGIYADTDLGSGAVTVTNSGTASATSTGGSSAAGIYTETEGSISITNSGTASSTTAGDATGVSAAGGGGITLINSGSASGISTGLSGTASAFQATTDGDVTFTGTGTGTLQASSAGSGAAAVALNSNTGNVTFSNVGSTITASGYNATIGISATADLGSITLTNGGLVSAVSTRQNGGVSAPGFAIYATTSGGPGNVAITNTGGLTAGSGYSSTYLTDAAGIYATTSGAGTISVTNSGAITAADNSGGTQIYGGTRGTGILAISEDGNVSVTNSGDQDINIQTTGFSVGIDAETTGAGSVSVYDSSTGTLTTSGINSHAGIQALSTGSFAYITNSQAISSLGGSYGYGIHAAGATDATVLNTGLVTVSGDYSYGVAAVSNGAGTAMVVNSGTVSSSGYYVGRAVEGIAGDGGTVDLMNSGTVSSSSQYLAQTIYASAGVGGTVSIINTGAVSASSSAYYADQYGIYATSGGDASVNNGGAVTVSSSSAYAAAVGIFATSSAGAVTINNTGAVTVTSSGYESNVAIEVSGAAETAVTNSAYLSVTGGMNGGQGTGILVTGAGEASVMNSGTMAITSFGPAAGISVNDSTGAATITNSATLTVVSMGGSTASGIYATTADALSITNSGSSSASSYGNATGIFANGLGGSVTVDNQELGTSAGSTSGYVSHSAGVYAVNTGVGTISISNEGTATASAVYSAGVLNGTPSAYGLYGMTDAGRINVLNTGTATATGSGLNNTVSGMYAGSNSGYVAMVNRGTTSAHSTFSHFYGGGTAAGMLAHSTTGDLYVVSYGNVTATATGQITASGINASTGGTAEVGNAGTVSVSSTGSNAYGMIANAPQSLVINIGTVDVNTSAGPFIDGMAATASVEAEVINEGDVSALGPSGTNSAAILISQGSTANVEIINEGTLRATGSNAFGIESLSSGTTMVNNDGTASGLVVGNAGTGAGIFLASFPQGGGDVIVQNSIRPNAIEAGTPSGGIFTVNNTGTAIGTTSGIYLLNAGTVNNSGTASGGSYSIFVPTDSLVTLSETSPIHGLLKGGADDTSNSLLDFNITIRGNFAAAKAALDAAIAQYEAAYTAANGDGADVTSEVVTLNNSQYQWQDFETVEDNLIQSAGRVYALTPGFGSEGGVIDHLDTTNPNAALILNSLDALPNGAVADALAQLSPKELEVFRNVAFDNNTFNVARINNHLANLRDGITGFDSSQLTIQDASMDSTLNQVRSRLLAYNGAPAAGLVSDSTEGMFGGTDSKDMKDMKSAVNTMPTQRWSSFISGDVILADLSDHTNVPDANYTTGNVMAGVDYRLDQHFTVGALFAYAHTDADLDSRGSSATVDSYSPGVYASYVDHGWYGNALGTYGRNAYTDDRHIAIPGLAGDNHGGTSGNQGTVNLTGGYEFQRGAFKFGPVATVQYVHLSIDSMDEGGGPASLHIDGQDEDSFRTLAGVEARYATEVTTPYGKVGLTPHVSASWQHECLDHADGITSQFNAAGGGSFSTQTDSPERDSAFLDLGLDATLNQNVTVFVDYENQAGQNHFAAQSAQGGVKIGF